jgi:hypothetical protein
MTYYYPDNGYDPLRYPEPVDEQSVKLYRRVAYIDKEGVEYLGENQVVTPPCVQRS